jgi:hypothetical protein
MTKTIQAGTGYIPTKFDPNDDLSGREDSSALLAQEMGDVRALEQWELFGIKVREAIESAKDLAPFNYKSKQGQNKAYVYIGTIRKLIKDINSARKDASDVHHKRWKGMIQAEKALTEPLEGLIQPHVDALTEIRKVEEARIQGHRDVIAEFQRFEQQIIREPGRLDRVATTSEEIEELCKQFRDFFEANPPEELEEFEEEAWQALERAQDSLLHAVIKAKEREAVMAREKEERRLQELQEREEREEEIRAEAAEQARQEERQRIAEEQAAAPPAPPAPPVPPAPASPDRSRAPGFPPMPPRPASPSSAMRPSQAPSGTAAGDHDTWRRRLAAELLEAMKGKSLQEIAGLIASDNLHSNVRAFARPDVFGVRH